MKNVLLLGDSIRYGVPPKIAGYGVYVKEKLADVVNVYAPDDNCRFAQYTLRYIHNWAKEVDAASIDVIHWNNGLWDVLRLDGDEPLTPIDMYVYMLERVHRMLRQLFPNAKIIFALSTAVLEKKARPDFFRYNADIEAYNAAARARMEALGVEINDLYEITKDLREEYHADWVHFNDKGSLILADAVAEKVLRALS